MLKRNRRWFSMSTLVFFLFFELFYFPAQNGFAQNLVSEVKSAQGFFLALPKDLGRVEITHTGQGPSLIHIQTAHGNYEAEQNIRKILHYLKNEHDFKTVFLEGSAFKLEPERLKLFKKHKKITYQILDQLMRRAFVKGSELFLLEDSEAQGFGVEHLETYVHNTRAFYEVLKQQKSTASFLTVLDEQIARLQSVFFSSDLRSFLKQKERYDEKEYDFLAWCELLRKKASKTLKIDLKDVAYQMDWPMLLRLFKLQELQSQINTQSFESEREKFLTNIKTIPKDLWIRVEKLLNANLSQDHLPNPETIKTFEAMIENLKADFDYEAYPQVKLFITHLILQSELDASRLQEEIDRLFIKISHSMMETDVQRKVFELYRHHELLTHLFELQLTPREYEQLSEHREKLSPKTLFENLSALNQDKRIELLNFEGVEEIEKLFGKSFEFYVLAKERDEKMIQNVEEQMQKQKVEKAVVITGGFHAEPFSEYFKEKLYNYALISPKMTDFEGQQSYVESMLQTLQPQSRESASATLESIPFASHSPQQILAMGFDPRQIALIFLDEAYRFLTSENTKFSPAQFNQMAMQGGAFKGFSLSFVKNEQGEDVFKITFPDGTIVYVGQQDVKQFIVRQTVGFDLGNPLNTIPGVSNQTAGTYLKLPQASSPAQSDSALLARPQSRAELRSIGSQNEEIVLKRSKETIVVGPVADPRDEPLSDLSLWTQLFGHRHSDENSISLKDLLADSIEAQQQAKGPFRFMDIGTGNGKIINLLKTRLQRMGLSKIEGVGIESDPGRWGMANSDPDRGYYVTDFLKLDETFPELMQKYDLLTLNAPQLSVRHLETDSQFQVKLIDFSSWLNQIKKIMKENGRLIIRLYEPESMVDGNEADWLHIESALLEEALKQHPDLQYTELGMNIQGLAKGSTPLGPAILVQFKNPPRAELRQSDDDDDDYSWVIPGGTLPADYQLDGRIGWDGLIGHRRDREATEIKFQDLVRNVLAEKRKGELLQFLDIGTGDGNFVSALKRVLNDQGISDVKGIGVDLKNATFLEADLTPGETYFQVDLQNPEEVITGVELNSQDFVFMNAPQLIKTVTSAGRKRFLSADDFSPWLKRAKSFLAEKGYLIIRLFEEKNDISDFRADWMKIESYLLWKALEEDPDLYFLEVRGDLADLPKGSTSVGPAIIVQKRSRAELRSGVDPLRRKDGGVFPEAVRAVEAIAATQNDVRRPVEEQPRRSDVEISAQAEAYQLFMEFTAKQQPELKDKLNEIVIHPADYDQFTRVHQPDVTEAAVISARFSPWDIRSILNQLKGDALLVIGYESYEADRANSDMQLLGEIKQEGLLEEFSMGQMPAGQHIIIARKARSELRADDVFLTDANEGSLFPEAVSAIEQIVASRNDPQPSDRGIDFRRMRISQAGAQKAAHQLFMMYAEKQQPQLRESLPSLMIFPTDYEKYQAQRTNKTEVVILSTAFSEHSIRLILESQRDDTLIVIGYEDDEKNVLEQHQKFLTRLQSEGLVKEFFSGEMATGQHILIARKARSELRSSFDKAFKGFAEMPAARTRLLAMIYENLHQNRSNKVAWYTNAGADIIHPLAVGNPDILIMNDRLDLFASEDFSDAAFQAEIDQMALNAATGEEALATFQEKGGALLPLLLRGFQQLGVSKEDLKAEVVRQKGQDVEQAIKFTFHWKHPAENEARLRVVYFLGRKPLQSLSDLPDKIEDFIVANKGLDLMIEKAPNYFKDLLRMDLEGLERESAEKTSAYRESQALIGQINSFRMNWLKKDGVILGDRESTEWPSSIGVLNREYAAQYSNIKYWKTRMYEFFSIGTLSKWGNGSSLIYQRTQGEPQGLKDREEKKKSSMLTPEIFQKAFQHRVGISEDDNQDFIEAFTNQFNQGVFDLVLDPRREAADDYDARATQALMNSDYSTAIIVRFEQILSVIRKGLDEGQAIEDIEEEVGKTQKFIVNYLRDVDQFGIILDTASLTSYNGISGIRAFIDYHAQALYILASRYAEARPDLKENPIANIFLRPILTDEEFDEAFKLLGRGVAIGDSEEFRGDFIEQYNEGFFDDVLNPQRNPDVYDYPQKINQAFSRSDISKALVLMFLQSLQVLRKGLDDGKSPEAILEEVKKITDKMSPHLNLEHDEDIFSGVIDDEVLEPYGGALGLMSYVNYIDHAVHILSDKYRKARSELRTDDEATSFEDSLNPELRRISLLEENEKNSQMLIPIALGYVELFEELASHGARADLEGTAVVDVELFFQDQQLKLRTSSGRSSPILGYDLLMKTLSDESKTDENGNIIRTQSIFFEPLDLQSSLARTMAQDNPNFIPYIYDDEYPVLFESQLSRDKKNMRNVNAIYVGGLYSNKFLKLEILKRKEGGDQWMPLLVSDVIFQSEAVSAVLGIDGKPFKMDRPDQIQRFISQGDLANILVRASFVDDPRKLRSELRSPEDYRERAKAKASILESEGYQYVLQIVPEDLRKNNGKSAQLSSVREMLSNISTENRWNENMTQRLTHLTHEILYNLIEHGEGAAFAITFDREGGKIKNIGIAALDSGVGIDDPNVLLNNSTRRKVRSFLEGVEPQVYGGNGFVTYMSRANDVVIESKGKRWQKSGMNHFKESHSDDVPEEGSKLSFTVDLSENVGPIHESYFLHRWTLFRLMKLLSENRWMPFGGHDIDGLTEVLMLSDDDLILKKQELFGEKNDTDRVGIIPTAIATGQYKTLDFKVYQKIIELSLELSNLQRSDFPEHATEQVKVRSEAFIQQWNERYQRQDGKPSREEGHLGVQFARADMEKGPGSIYEFNALRQFANDFLDDRDLPLQNKAETLVADITIILTELKKASLLTEEMESRLLRNIPILQESAKLYQQRMIGYLPNKEEVLQEYYEAASFTFRVIPTLIESIFRIKKSSEISSMYAIEDGFEVQNETSMHFDIRTGFEYRQREQIGIPNEVNALEHFRENPARVIAAYQYALEKNLPLSHQLRLALIQYQAEFQNWLDSQRLKRKPKESFTEVGRRFLKIMESDQSVMAVLWDMYRSGVLEAVVPELRKVQNLASNFEVHAFTVGQHTLYNLKNFESLRHASGPEPSEGEIIASRLNAAERRQMRLALLFHDLGKRISKTTIEADHAIVSARQIVPKRLKELGATQEDIQAVMWIVRDHMVLNAYAYYFKGDEFETKLPVIKNVIGIDPEASSERLKLLYLISLTDREALNPWLDMLNPDTLTRLNRIYSELEDFLASTGDHNRRHDIQALQQMAHEETRMGWETYKTNKSEGLRSRLENLNSETVKDYLSHMVLINDASIENKLMDRAKQIASDPQVFDELLERLFASFSLNKIRDFRIDQTLRRLLFLIHIQIQKESQSAAPLIYFNPYLSRTYERGYEILVGAGIDTTGFFEKATGVLLLHGFDIEEADIRTLSSGEILDKFHGFFHGDYPDEGAYQKLIEQITKDMNDVLMGVVPSIEALFKRANKPYLSQQSIESIETSVQFLEDESIYGVAASVFNLKTGNRLGLLHALSIILRRGGYNLVTAPVSTHPSMVNDIFYINKDGRTLTPKEKTDLVEEIRGVVSKRFIVFSDLRASRHELRNSDSETEASTASIRVPLAEAIAAIQSRISETESNEVFEELFTNSRLLSELVREYRGRSQRLDSFGLQAGWNKQAVVELVSNAMDWTLAGRGVTPIGRFAIGALQSFELLENEGDYVSWTSSTDGKNAYQLKVILTSEGSLDLELSSPVSYDFERGTKVEISKKGEVWKDYQDFLIKSFGLNTRVPIHFVENGMESILNPLDLQQEREIFLINGSQSEKLAKHFYPDDRIQVQVQDDVLSVRDWGLGMSPKTFLTRLIRPRSGNNENPNKKLTQEEIHQRVKVFYEKQGMIRADERVSSHISLQVAGVEIESVDVTGFNLPHMLAIELPAETNLSTERGNIALDEMTRDSMIAAIDKILNLEGAEKIPLLNAMAALLRKWQSKDGKQYEILLNTVQKKIRDWLEVERFAKPNQIVLPNRITLREEEKEEGQYFNEDAFQYLSLNADDEVIYLDDILFPFDPKKISKFKRVSNWYSDKGYQVWVVPFKESSNEIYFLHQNYIVVDEEHYRRHAANPAVLTQHINPILDYVPESLKTGRLRGHFILRQEKKTSKTDAPAPQQKTDTEWDILEGLKGYLIKQGLTAEQAQERIVSARVKTEEIIRENGLNQTPLFADSDSLASYDFHLAGYGALFNFLILYPDEMENLKKMGAKVRNLVAQDFFTLHDAGQIIYDYVMSYGAGAYYQKALKQVLEKEEREKEPWVSRERQFVAQALARAGYFFHAEFLSRDALRRIVEQDRNLNASAEVDVWDVLSTSNSNALEKVGLIRGVDGR
jgi:UTP:GlnB (protein PII) uridylyltransferase/anti-sigma regulatory factor (Ser/Thr protein kinase)/methylase of polypeptide subunit release factors